MELGGVVPARSRDVHLSGTDRSRIYRFSLRAAFFIIASILLSGCLAATTRPRPQQTVGLPPDGEEVAAERTATYQELEAEIARLQLRLLEKETLTGELEKKVDEAIQEVVRAKAKLHSLESKAEAASTIAEAEIALKALKAKAVRPEEDPTLTDAEHLLKMSGREFKKQNYGGALYLASQAKALVSKGQGRLMTREKLPIRPGEVLFAMPLPLQALGKSNIRQGPGLDFKILFTLEKDTPLVGHSFKNEWVRVKSEDGRGGWVFHTLLGGR